MSLTDSGLLVAVSLLAGAALLFFRTKAWSGLFAKLTNLSARDLIAPAMVFALVAVAGVATSLHRDASEAHGRGEVAPVAHLHAAGDDDALTRLKEYARSTGADEPTPLAATEPKLPDVDTMIERLKQRLEAKPDDAQGWQMLGWSYFHTERYEQAAEAYAKAVDIDPASSELKRAHEEAKERAAASNSSKAASSLQKGFASHGDEGSGGAAIAASEALVPHEREADIRSMIDELSARLESTPRDVEGWARLIRVRVVLGEQEMAETAFVKALDIFKDDAAASGKIISIAMGLGLNVQ